jgi:hypothetical protein
MNLLVVGKAKSGTTIISKTIQASAGVEHYHLEKRKLQFFESQHLAQPLLVKLLFEDWGRRSNLLRGICLNEATLRFGKVVLIVRDPRDVLVSLLMFRSAQLLADLPDEATDEWIELLRCKESFPRQQRVAVLFSQLGRIAGVNLEFARLVRSFLPWFNFVRDLGRKNVFCLKYEDFMRGRLQGLEAYLGFPIAADREVGAYVNTPRTRGVDNWKEFFMPADLDQVDGLIGARMRQLGYEDWELGRAAPLVPEFYSDYVLKVIGNIRARRPAPALLSPAALQADADIAAGNASSHSCPS